MSEPDYTSRVYSGQWPYRDTDSRDYFIFSIINDQGYAADVLYRDLSLPDTVELIHKVARAWIEKRKLKIWLSDTINKRVSKVEFA